MQYLLLLYDAESRSANLDQAGQALEFREFGEFGQKFAKAIKGGNALQPVSTAKTVRVRNGETLATDGPFAETKEQLGGYYLIEAADENEAIAIAAKVPWSRYGSTEVRPIMKFS
jgi:hypothetical protein